MTKRKIARFEITKAGKVGEEFSDDPNDCELVLEIPNKYIAILIEELKLSLLFNGDVEEPDGLLCILVSGKPHPQIYTNKDGVESKRPPTFLSEEFANKPNH